MYTIGDFLKEERPVIISEEKNNLRNLIKIETQRFLESGGEITKKVPEQEKDIRLFDICKKYDVSMSNIRKWVKKSQFPKTQTLQCRTGKYQSWEKTNPVFDSREVDNFFKSKRRILFKSDKRFKKLDF